VLKTVRFPLLNALHFPPAGASYTITPGNSDAMPSATLSSKFKLAIPKPIRDELGLHVGQRFAIIPKGRGIELVPLPSLDEVRGLLKGADPTGYRDREDRY